MFANENNNYPLNHTKEEIIDTEFTDKSLDEFKTNDDVELFDEINITDMNFNQKSGVDSYSNKSSSVERSITKNTESTNPNNATYFNFNTGLQGNISTASEIRWYITQINEKSKVSLILQLSSEQNFDLYLFKYNQTAGKLDAVAASALEIGKNESIDADWILGYIL